MLITLSFGGAIAIFPFAILRSLNGEWLIGLIDFTLIVIFSAIGTFVYNTHNTRVASLVVTTIALVGMTIVVYLKGPEIIYWAYPTMVGVYFILAPRQAFTLTMITVLALIPAVINKIEMSVFIALIMTLIVNNLFAYVFSKRMHDQGDQLSLLVRRDPLTGAGNRRALAEKLHELIAMHERTKQISTLVVLDVDHFKSINDNYGHNTGDQVLIELCNLITSRIRATDSLFRFGGEEFIVVLIGASLYSARDVAESLRTIIETAQLIEDKTITISLGVAEYIENESADNWLDRCDKAMYRAKETGRNKTCVATL